ncbi:TetR/AcrR family transcriptional regulator [Devosia sp. MC1541]|uniref:TetR/AcrR family transcriptional regulator n=1 Tax=Devosia sp. MC1541 TaxID=2725264 RepID=UPI00145E0A7B|nr:TetR/AcrR family transcriptional regulator [Devosia sp. MC1541]
MARKTRAEMMVETRAKLLAAGRKAFAEHGYADASMDTLTADVGLTRGALYHNFGDKRGLLAAVVNAVDTEMAARAHDAVRASNPANLWEQLVAEGIAYMELATDPEIRRIVLLDGPAVLGDPSQWESQSACLVGTRSILVTLMEEGVVKRMDIEAAARLMNGAALNAALWVAASSDPDMTLPKARDAFRHLMRGFLAQ